MTPDERTLLTRYLNDLAAAGPVSKDPEAASLISQALGSNPDAVYLLVQHAIIADHALQEAREQIAGLQAQLAAQSVPPQQQASHFLGDALESGPWGRRPQQAPAANPVYNAPSAFPQVQGQPSGFASFLRSAGTTAVGVAAGSALFSGIESLFGGRSIMGGQGLMGGGGLFGNAGGFGNPAGFGGGETVIVNNYNDDTFNDNGQSGSDDSGYDSSDDSGSWGGDSV